MDHPQLRRSLRYMAKSRNIIQLWRFRPSGLDLQSSGYVIRPSRNRTNLKHMLKVDSRALKSSCTLRNQKIPFLAEWPLRSYKMILMYHPCNVSAEHSYNLELPKLPIITELAT